MGRTPITVIVPAGLADGYRLAGVRTEQADTVTAAGAALDRLIAGHDRPSVIAVHHQYLRELGSRRQRRLAELDSVLVVELPEGVADGAPGSGGESLRDLLARAVGYEFTFDPGEGTL
jgi:vacuolar-type H+-ATPase subunit F/Vma7